MRASGACPAVEVAIDRQAHAADGRCLWAGQKSDGVGDILRPHDALQRIPVLRFLEDLRIDRCPRFPSLRTHGSRSNSIGTDAEFSVFDSDQLRQMDQACLCRAIGGMAEHSHAVDGGDIDDRPLRALKRVLESPEAEKRCFQVKGIVLAPYLCGRVVQADGPCSTSIVDEGRDITQLRNLQGQPCKILRIGDVAGFRNEGGTGKQGKRIGKGIGIDIDQHHLRVAFRKRRGNCPADVARRARYDGDLVFPVLHVMLLLRSFPERVLRSSRSTSLFLRIFRA